MSTHHDADSLKLKHCLGRLLAAGEVDGTTDPSAAVQTLIRAHPEYGRRPVGPLRAAVREALTVASPRPKRARANGAPAASMNDGLRGAYAAQTRGGGGGARRRASPRAGGAAPATNNAAEAARAPAPAERLEDVVGAAAAVASMREAVVEPLAHARSYAAVSYTHLRAHET